MMVPAPLPNIYATNPSSGRVEPGRTWPNWHQGTRAKPLVKDMEGKGLEDYIANKNPSKSFEG